MRDLAAALALGPVLLLQGIHVRRRTPRLPEPPGDRRGTAGVGRTLRLLIAGDSAAAGVGAGSQDEALTGRLVDRLRGDFRVSWRLEAATGATTPDTLARLSDLPRAPWDVLVTSLGVNDISRRTSMRAWLEDQRALRSLARTRFGVSRLVIAGLPPVDRFPALPQPLRWYLGGRARRFTERLAEDVAGEADARVIDLRFPLGPEAMAEDGFHPGPPAYREWADRTAAVIRATLG